MSECTEVWYPIEIEKKTAGEREFDKARGYTTDPGFAAALKGTECWSSVKVTFDEAMKNRDGGLARHEDTEGLEGWVTAGCKWHCSIL
jgi:hypothetical protein